MNEVVVNRSGGLSLLRNSVVRLTDRLDMTIAVYRERKKHNNNFYLLSRAIGRSSTVQSCVWLSIFQTDLNHMRSVPDSR